MAWSIWAVSLAGVVGLSLASVWALEYDRDHPGTEGHWFFIFAVGYLHVMLSSVLVFATTRRASATGGGPGANSRANTKGCLTILAGLVLMFGVVPAIVPFVSGIFLWALPIAVPLLWLAVMVWCPIALYRSSRS